MPYFSVHFAFNWIFQLPENALLEELKNISSSDVYSWHISPFYCFQSVGRRSIKVTISGKVFQVSKILVPDLKRGLQMSIFLSPGTRFSKVPKSFRTRKAVAKSRTLWLQSCFIHVLLIWTEVLFIQEVSGVYTSLFLDTDELKMVFRARKVSGAFEKRAGITCITTNVPNEHNLLDLMTWWIKEQQLRRQFIPFNDKMCFSYL